MYAALLLSLFTALATDARSQCMAWTHIHPMSPASRELLNTSIHRSGVVRELLGELEQTDVIVLLVLSIEPATTGRRPHMRFLSTTGNVRYVVIQMYTVNEPPVMQVPTLAHELRHALELAGAPGVRDPESFSRLFAAIGWQSGPRRFETDAARITERQVRRELHGIPLTRRAEPGTRTPPGDLP